jgi:anaerobic selenocysteine-containing dehydrogenase
VPPKGECKPFQEVLIELGTRLKLPAFVTKDGTRKYRDYPDFIVNYETEPGSGIGFLSGWRGKGGEKFLKGEPNPASGRCTPRTTASTTTRCRSPTSTCATGTRATWTGRRGTGSRATPTRSAHLYSEVLQKFRLAAQGKGDRRKPPAHLKQRIETYLRPAALLLRAAGSAG